MVRNGKATGVVLQNGEELHAKEVVAAVDPTSLFTRLVVAFRFGQPRPQGNAPGQMHI
jgi:hypothetical protein